MTEKALMDQEKIDEYFHIIEERILAPLQNTDIQKYCTATLLILFAAIDGLGKLLHPKDKANPGERTRAFLDYMGENYKDGFCKDKLWILRNSLAHNAINVESFLSHADIGIDQHLKKVGVSNIIYVNTTVMNQDVRNAFERFKIEIKANPKMMKCAADRLQWRTETEDNLSVDLIAQPSPPAAVGFIYAR
jgi:hypothetical protein